jgi:hypothetical protein
MIRKDCVLGSGVTWADIEKVECGLCDACLHARMHALPIYASLSRKNYENGEYLTSDYYPYGFTTICGFTGGILFIDKNSGKMWIYHVKNKSEWLAKLQLWILENGKGRNPGCVELRYLLTDYATEVHSHDMTNFLKESKIKLKY